jgi:hypothetical protein
MKTRIVLLTVLATVLVAILAAAPVRALAQKIDAASILKAMSDYMGSQKTIELRFDSDIEVVTPQLEKIQFTNSGEALLSRPDKLRAHRVGGYADVALYFDGKTASVFGKHINGCAQFDAPGSVDHLIEALRLGYGIALPGADLHRPDIVVSMNGKSWATLYVNQTDLASLVDDGEAKMMKGDLKSAEALLDLFDVFEPVRNVTIPPAYH